MKFATPCRRRRLGAYDTPSMSRIAIGAMGRPKAGEPRLTNRSIAETTSGLAGFGHLTQIHRAQPLPTSRSNTATVAVPASSGTLGVLEIGTNIPSRLRRTKPTMRSPCWRGPFATTPTDIRNLVSWQWSVRCQGKPLRCAATLRSVVTDSRGSGCSSCNPVKPHNLCVY